MKAYDLSNLDVLVVEPNGFMRTIMRTIMHSLGVRSIRDATDTKTALSMFKNQPSDVVLMDWSPKLNGGKLLSDLRGSESPCPFVPIIIVSAHTEMRHICQARDMGMTEYLAKPISARAVYDRIIASVENAREFIRIDSYFGPDRRRHRAGEHTGIERRAAMAA